VSGPSPRRGTHRTRRACPPAGEFFAGSVETPRRSAPSHASRVSSTARAKPQQRGGRATSAPRLPGARSRRLGCRAIACSCPRSRWSARGLEHGVAGRRIAIRCRQPPGARVRRLLAGPRRLRRRSRSVSDNRRRAPTWQVLVLPLDSGRRRAGASRNERPAARRTRRRPAGRAAPAAFASGATTTVRSCGSSTSGPFGGLSVVADGADLPAPIAHIARDPLDAEFDEAAFATRRCADGTPESNAPCSTRVWCRSRQHLADEGCGGRGCTTRGRRRR